MTIISPLKEYRLSWGLSSQPSVLKVCLLTPEPCLLGTVPNEDSPNIWQLLEQGINPFPNNKILDSSKLKEFAFDNFKFDENGRKFSKRLENTVGKGEIAHYETCTAAT